MDELYTSDEILTVDDLIDLAKLARNLLEKEAEKGNQEWIGPCPSYKLLERGRAELTKKFEMNPNKSARVL